MLADFDRYGVKQVTVHDSPPPFEPAMLRGQDILGSDPDWMTQMLGSNLERNLLHSAHRGAVSNMAGTSYVPALAEGLHFGQRGPTKGFEVKSTDKV